MSDWYLFTVYLLHIIAVAIPLIYIGYKKTDTEDDFYQYLQILGISALDISWLITNYFIMDR